MDSDDEDLSLSFVSSNRSVAQAGGSKRPSRQVDAGLLAELHSPSHSPGDPKRRSFLTTDSNDLRAFAAHESRNAAPISTMSVRPVTAMSQAGDMSAAIPDLDELREAGEAPEAVKAPFMAMNNLYSYQELEKDLMKNAAFTSFDDIDFSPLFARLLPESEVMLEDENWSWDKLVASVSSSLPSNKTS